MEKTIDLHKKFTKIAKDIYSQKERDYGQSMKHYRNKTFNSQLEIKLLRIRTIQDKREMQVKDSLESEFLALLNYSVIGILRLQIDAELEKLSSVKVSEMYDKVIADAQELMEKKNADYGEAWKMQPISALSDFMYSKVIRVKEILKTNTHSDLSGSPVEQYMDVINYSVFCLALIAEGVNPMD